MESLASLQTLPSWIPSLTISPTARYITNSGLGSVNSLVGVIGTAKVGDFMVCETLFPVLYSLP